MYEEEVLLDDVYDDFYNMAKEDKDLEYHIEIYLPNIDFEEDEIAITDLNIPEINQVELEARKYVAEKIIDEFNKEYLNTAILNTFVGDDDNEYVVMSSEDVSEIYNQCSSDILYWYEGFIEERYSDFYNYVAVALKSEIESAIGRYVSYLDFGNSNGEPITSQEVGKLIASDKEVVFAILSSGAYVIEEELIKLLSDRKIIVLDNHVDYDYEKMEDRIESEVEEKIANLENSMKYFDRDLDKLSKNGVNYKSIFRESYMEMMDKRIYPLIEQYEAIGNEPNDIEYDVNIKLSVYSSEVFDTIDQKIEEAIIENIQNFRSSMVEDLFLDDYYAQYRNLPISDKVAHVNKISPWYIMRFYLHNSDTARVILEQYPIEQD